ncbi:MAG: DNA-processing protein DprA [Candidatus Omnitrophica bacterium]|nr:DNA-processing protein DprA [Candidatus Omnitrophota bacterium]
MTEHEAILILNAIQSFGNRKKLRLLEFFKTAKTIVSASFQELSACPLLNTDQVESILHFKKDHFLKAEGQRLRKQKIHLLTLNDPGYPSLLKEISDAPLLLYIRGQLPNQVECCLAIVGSRRCSIYGQNAAYEMGAHLAERNFVIVSGLARGIDTAAHQGVLKVKGKTVAVLGCGLNNTYPPENKKLMEEIVERGAVISEFPLETPPSPYHFPRRNRIISGLSSGTIIVEAAQKSGALITADFAMEQGREVFAVPGEIHKTASKGTNQLIQQGAKLVTSIEDIIEEIPSNVWETQLSQMEKNLELSEKDNIFVNGSHESSRVSTLSQEEQILLDQIPKRKIHLEDLCAKSNLDVVQINPVLLSLELKKHIKHLPGQIYQKI